MIKNIGIMVGRFQPLTKAHVDIINQMSIENEKCILFLVKSKKEDNIRNPFSESIQRKIINEILPNNVDIITIHTAYFVDYINQLKCNSFTVYCGSDRVNQYKRFTSYMEDGRELYIKEISRTDDDISATKVRDALKNNDINTFKELIDERVHKYFKVLQHEINK